MGSHGVGENGADWWFNSTPPTPAEAPTLTWFRLVSRGFALSRPYAERMRLPLWLRLRSRRAPIAPTPPPDTATVILSPGMAVLPSEAVDTYGEDLLRRIGRLGDDAPIIRR